MTKHLMIDLETMGTAPGSAIASIGAVVFDPEEGSLGAEFYRVIDLQSCVRAGLTFDPNTIIWWLRQSQEARAALTEQEAEGLPAALGWLRMFYMKECKGAPVWGHGGNFDEPLLAWAFRAAHVVLPWNFWDSRCTRTIFDLAGVKPDRQKGVHHNALDDAKAQAEAVCRAYRALGKAAS